MDRFLHTKKSEIAGITAEYSREGAIKPWMGPATGGNSVRSDHRGRMAHHGAHVRFVHGLQYDHRRAAFLANDANGRCFGRKIEQAGELLDGLAFVLRMLRRGGDENMFGRD